MTNTVWRGVPTPRLRLDVYRRAGFACQRCGLKYAAPDNYDGRYALGLDVVNRRGRTVHYILELDHVMPYKLGGRYKRDNLQALCSGCNARKGAGV